MNRGTSVFDSLRRLRNDTQGAAFLEFTIFVGVFFTLLFGIIEFLLAFYQWNAATKAVQFGARLAAVSNPVAEELKTLTGPGGGTDPTAPMPEFYVTCWGITETTGDCECSGALTDCNYSPAAMATLVYGRGNSGPDCGGQAPNIGMCNLFGRIAPQNVVIEYNHTGLGYAGRPAAEYAEDQFTSHVVPTITVRIDDPAQPIPFQFFFLAGLLGFDNIDIPGLLSTVTGEDLSSGS
jgi:hypothetical protein